MPRARKAINQINVVPYIDVMLVLLVIFMITAPLVNPGQIELPTVGSKLTAPVLPLEITLKPNRSMEYRDHASTEPSRAVTKSELIGLLRAKQGPAGERPVVINADKSANYGEVIELIDLLQQNGIKRVGLLARPKPG